MSDRTDVKQLLEQATPLPWTRKHAVMALGPDSDLIVHAVNHLPDYEAAVDALEHFVESWGGNYEVKGRLIDCEESYKRARAALARLRIAP